MFTPHRIRSRPRTLHIAPAAFCCLTTPLSLFSRHRPIALRQSRPVRAPLPYPAVAAPRASTHWAPFVMAPSPLCTYFIAEQSTTKYHGGKGSYPNVLLSASSRAGRWLSTVRD